MIGLLMMLGFVVSVVGFVGCGGDNPTSSKDLLVGSWIDENGVGWTFSSDGILTNGYWDELKEEGEEYPIVTWSIDGDNLIWTTVLGDITTSVTFPFSVTDESLTITIDGTTETLTRIG